MEFQEEIKIEQNISLSDEELIGLFHEFAELCYFDGDVDKMDEFDEKYPFIAKFKGLLTELY